LEPDHVEEYIDLLLSLERYDEAAKHLADIVNNDKFRSIRGKSNYQLWMELCELVIKQPHEIKSLKVEPIIRSGIRRFTDQVGKLWNSLASYWIKLGHFEKVGCVAQLLLFSVLTFFALL
jgi:pre-mRNA-splicing factor SYF1